MPVLKTSKLLLPYEPGYTGHWKAEKRRKETRAWLRQRERGIAACASPERQTVAPSILPDHPELDAVTGAAKRR
jgi:hypothetical protein